MPYVNQAQDLTPDPPGPAPSSSEEPAGPGELARLTKPTPQGTAATASWLQEIREYWARICGKCGGSE